MMGHDNFGHAAEGAEPLLHTRNLARVDPPAFESCRTRGIDSQYRDLRIAVKWFKVIADVTPVSGKLQGEAREDVIQRNVVIAGHDNFRKQYGIQEFPRGDKLFLARS